jgi:molybdate transport system substrate-binding protein
MLRRRRVTTLLAAASTLLAAVIATSGATAAPERQSAQITVLAAASLTDVLPQIDPGPRYSFAGSNQLAAQIQQGVPADVFASANSTIPDQLYAKGLLQKPVAFTSNKLVLITPSSNPAGIKSVFDLRKPGVKLVIGNSSVPVGAYTRTVLKNLHLTEPVLANVVSNESDVRSVLSKVALGEADAGFVYVTDAKTVAGRVEVLQIPARAEPRVRYEMAVISSSRNKKDARAFIDKVLAKAGQARLRAAGFGAPVGAGYKAA